MKRAVATLVLLDMLMLCFRCGAGGLDLSALHKSARAGELAARLKLVIVYGTEPDLRCSHWGDSAWSVTNALQWAQLAVEQATRDFEPGIAASNACATFKLGWVYNVCGDIHGGGAVTTNYAGRAKSLIRLAAERGDPEAMYWAALACEDRPLARQFIERSAKLGHPGAQEELARKLAGGGEDARRAFTWAFAAFLSATADGEEPDEALFVNLRSRLVIDGDTDVDLRRIGEAEREAISLFRRTRAERNKYERSTGGEPCREFVRSIRLAGE